MSSTPDLANDVLVKIAVAVGALFLFLYKSPPEVRRLVTDGMMLALGATATWYWFQTQPNATTPSPTPGNLPGNAVTPEAITNTFDGLAGQWQLQGLTAAGDSESYNISLLSGGGQLWDVVDTQGNAAVGSSASLNFVNTYGTSSLGLSTYALAYVNPDQTLATYILPSDVSSTVFTYHTATSSSEGVTLPYQDYDIEGVWVLTQPDHSTLTYTVARDTISSYTLTLLRTSPSGAATTSRTLLSPSGSEYIGFLAGHVWLVQPNETSLYIQVFDQPSSVYTVEK